jgi:hypothetical protein
MINAFTRFVVYANLLLNRFFSKLMFGAIDVTTISLVTFLLFRFRQVLFIVLKNKSYMYLLSIAIGWLIYEAVFIEVTMISLRRFSFLLYMLVPIILILADFRIKINEKRVTYLIFILFIVSLLQAAFKTGLNMSLLATFSAYLILYSFYSYKLTIKTLKYMLINVCILMFFLLYPAIFYAGGMYKTPIAALIISTISLLSYSFFIKRSFSYSKFLLLFLSFIMLIFALTYFDFGRKILYEVFYGLHGLFDIDFMKHLADSLAVEVDRGSRGSSYDSSQTRLFFWTTILNGSMDDIQTFLLGHGHSRSFLEELAPDFKFIDVNVMSPHNSFMTLIFQYGFIGFFLFFSYMRKIISIANRSLLAVQVDKNIIIGSIVFSCVYASFEVALESPHGAILFWFIILFSSKALTSND